MAINLVKRGEAVDLTKNHKGLEEITIGLKWGNVVETKSESKGKGLLARLFDASVNNKPTFVNSSIDVDSSVVLVDSNGRKVDRIYYAKRNGTGIHHAGDDRTGSNQYGKEDNEEIYVKLKSLSHNVEELYVVANIFSGSSHFGEIRGSYMRLIDTSSREELVRYELDDFKGMGGVVLGKVYRHKGEWKFRAIGEGLKTNSLERIEEKILRG